MATSLISMRDAVLNKPEGGKSDAIPNKSDAAANRFEELP